MSYIGKIIFVLSLLNCSLGRKHHYVIQNDIRKYIPLTSFGYYDGGLLEVHVENFQLTPENVSYSLGFSMHQSTDSLIGPNFENHHTGCTLRHALDPINIDVTYFNFDLKYDVMNVRCNMEKMRQVYIAKQNIPSSFRLPRKNRLVRDATDNKCGRSIPLTSKVIDGHKLYNASFVMFFYGLPEEGFYRLYFHNCPNYSPDDKVAVNFTIDIVEQNRDTYLSAGQIPLPALYFIMALTYLMSGVSWVFHLKQSKHPVFKIHQILTLVIFLKTTSLTFQGIMYHYIDRIGTPLLTWAVLFYTTRLLKDMVLFVALILVGSGWTFMKRMLTFREKMLLTIVIVLRSLAGTAEIVTDEIDEVNIAYSTWENVFLFSDFLSCLVVMIAVGCSLRFSAVSETNAKAAMNFRNLFKHFFIILSCFMYTAKVIIYLMKICVSYQYNWLNYSAEEIVTYVFFILILYIFRPAALNSYLALTNDDDDDVDLDNGDETV